MRLNPADRQAETFLGANWTSVSKNNARYLVGNFTLAEGGQHVLRVGMIDPAVVLLKIIINSGDLPASYFGPPEQDCV